MALLLGYDVGSSSVKATVMDSVTGNVLVSATSPKKELDIIAQKAGWAEQEPDVWWDNVVGATQQIKSSGKVDLSEVAAIGISYQMHGLVCVDKDKQILRPAIIWCDSRTVEIGEAAALGMGQEKCLTNLLNLPGNFTASKLKWVMDNEPEVYARIHKIMLPGDYIAMKMTGEIQTTVSGLSEGIMWDYRKNAISEMVLDYFGIDGGLIGDVVETFSEQGRLSRGAAGELGLKAGVKICYRAGDQPNNAFSLNVLKPGQVATTAGTSGVVCGITDKTNFDDKSRVNAFVHVNHKADDPRYTVLLCVNGAGILNSWLRHNVAGGMSYEQMNELAGKSPVGSDGLVILPYGNGAERPLVNNDIGASIGNLNFNIHDKSHLLRAGQEGVVFAMNYGLDIMRGLGIEINMVRAGHANMFLSPLFSSAFATLTGATVELYNTDGSQGAARGAGVGSGVYANLNDAFGGLRPVKTIEPDGELSSAYQDAYGKWEDYLNRQLG